MDKSKINVQKCLEILREIKDVSFATVDENGYPQVRIIDIMLVEEGKLYFITARGKEFYKELNANARVAIVGMNNEYKAVRLNGIVSRLDCNKAWINRIFRENPTLESIYPNESRYILEPYCINEGEVELFDLSGERIYRESFSLGKGRVHHKGFYISDNCIECGKCRNSCPQQCIEINKPYVIREENCLHCGWCFETCPVKAIEKVTHQII